MTKIILLLSLLFHFSYGCATCLLMTPSVELDVKLYIEEKNLQKLHFTWHFSEEFTNELVLQYDKNQNEKLDSEELESILQAKLDYLKPKHMLTSIQYADENASEAIPLQAIFNNFSIDTVNSALVFSYDATLQKVLMHNDSLSISLVDDESYFTFSMRELDVNKCDFAYSKNLYSHIASILFKDKSLIHEISKPVALQDVKTPVVPVEEVVKKEVLKQLFVLDL